MSLEADIFAALASVEDPEIRRPITDLGMVKSIAVADGVATVGVYLTVGACPMRDTIENRVLAAVSAVEGITEVVVELDVMNEEQRKALREKLQGPAKPIPFQELGDRTRIFAVTSGKGGVGKSSVTVNLAAALTAQGLRVGILDADIYGHSIPNMLGIDTPVTQLDDTFLLPPEKHGIKALSILPFKPGGASEPVAYRGPMLTKVLEQFLADFYWDDCDVMLLDLPPGTGDIAMSVGQLLPNSVLAGDIKLISQIPFDARLREGGDEGMPIVFSDPDSAAAKAFLQLATDLMGARRSLEGMSLKLSPVSKQESHQ